MKREEHQLALPGVEEMTPQDAEEWEKLMGMPLSESALKMDMGTAVTPEEKQGLTDNALIHHGSGDKMCAHAFAPNNLFIKDDNAIICPKCRKVAGYVAIGGGSGD